MRKDRIKNEYDYHKYWKDMYEKEHKLRQEAQGELTIIKGIGNNSPEMKKLQKENKELKEDNKKISRQIEDRINQMRKSGM